MKWKKMLRQNDDGVCKLIHKDITLKRLSEPEDVAAAVNFLAGPVQTMHWSTIIVDGGMQFH